MEKVRNNREMFLFLAQGKPLKIVFIFVFV